MLILALDTTTRAGSVAVVRDDRVLVVMPGDESRTHGERLPAEIATALDRAGVRGADGEIDHIELIGPPTDPANHARNFVLCPGGAYDRSPCGTGTSAKLACLAADGKLKPGEPWRQESVIGSVFEGRFAWADGGRVVPSVTGTAFVTAEATLLADDDDPLKDGIRADGARG